MSYAEHLFRLKTHLVLTRILQVVCKKKNMNGTFRNPQDRPEISQPWDQKHQHT